MSHHRLKEDYQESEYDFPYHYIDLGFKTYSRLYSIEYLAKIDLIRQCLDTYSCSEALDAGCGDGRICYELRLAGYSVAGLDYSERALAFARAFNPGVPFYQQDLRTIAIEKHFSAVLLIDVLEHLPPESIAPVLSQLANCLTQNGILVVTVPSVRLQLLPKHYQHFDAETLKDVLSVDFEVLELIGYCGDDCRRMVFKALRLLGLLFVPFQHHVSSFSRPVERCARTFYKRYLATGMPQNSLGLLAICRKRSLTPSS